MQPACGSVRLTVRPSDSKDVASSEDVATQKVRLSSAEARNPASPTISLAPLIASNKPNAVACCKWGALIALRR